MFFRRVLAALKGLVAGGDAGDLCGRRGLESFTDDLRPVGLRLRRLFYHNLKVITSIQPSTLKKKRRVFRSTYIHIVVNIGTVPQRYHGYGGLLCVHVVVLY